MSYEQWQDVKPQQGKQELAFSMLGKVDFMLWGGARFGGKSELLNMVPAVYANDPKFRGIFFRRQFSEIMGANSLWEKAENMYPLFGAYPRISSTTWTFPSGSKQIYSHMFYEKDKESHRGKGYSLIGFDEIDQFSKEQVTFLMTCLRSEAKMDSFCLGTLNPNPDSWCLPLVEYYLKDDGLPDPDKCGDIRWFIVKDGDFVFGPSEEWFKEHYPDCLWISVPNQDEKIYVRPKRFTYMFFNIFDNPLGLNANPVYLSELNNLPDHERDTQLYGNWYSRPEGNKLWKRSWVRGAEGERVKQYKDIPQGLKWFRGWDKGYTVPNDTNRHPDYTAGSSKIAKDSSGMYWLVGDFVPENYDVMEEDVPAKERINCRFRQLTGERDSSIIRQALSDGDDCSVVLTKDSGGAATDHTFTKSRLVGERIRVIEDKSPKNTQGKKLKDFQPFANACQLGLVFIVENSFNKQTLDAIYNELESFDPDKRSTSARRDDIVDCHSLAFNASSVKKAFRLTPRNQKRSSTEAVSVLNHSAGIQEQYAQHAQPDLTDLN